MHDEREIHRRRMKALIDQGLGEIERGHAGVLQELVVEQRFVHAGSGIGRADDILESGEEIIRR